MCEIMQKWVKLGLFLNTFSLVGETDNILIYHDRHALAAGSFFIHSGWNGLRLGDDIGLVRLPAPIVPNGKFTNG